VSGTLIEITPQYQTQLEEFLCEFDQNPTELNGYFCPRDWDIHQVIDFLTALSRGEKLKAGWVPCTTLFWVEDHQIQGVINIRHELTPSLRELGGHIGYCVAPSHRCKGVATSMLTSALDLCKQKQIIKVLLTCNTTNHASVKVIERCGGLLEKEEWVDREQKSQRWYWINLS
jgi:predicted acetyltransferase